MSYVGILLIFEMTTCSHIHFRQLDILGTRLVSAEAVENLLHRCKKMEFIDVSFCYSFTVEVVESLRQAYPHVAIKRSFQD